MTKEDIKTASQSFQPREVPGELEMYDGELRKVVNPHRQGWWRFNSRYDRDGYCDNPARGY